LGVRMGCGEISGCPRGAESTLRGSKPHWAWSPAGSARELTEPHHDRVEVVGGRLGGRRISYASSSRSARAGVIRGMTGCSGPDGRRRSCPNPRGRRDRGVTARPRVCGDGPPERGVHRRAGPLLEDGGGCEPVSVKMSRAKERSTVYAVADWRRWT
jgi:hypothetical protein